MTDGSGSAVRVGLVGAGTWAEMVHAPTFAAGPETRLVGIWSRRPEAARALAEKHHARPFERYEDLLESCEAVVFAVPPAVQPQFVLTAARQQKVLLLEKPLAAELTEARRVAETIAELDVKAMLCLSYRFSAKVRKFLATCAASDFFGGRGCFVSGALLGGPFAGSPWRHEQNGLLLDLGPHMVDLMEAALGRVRTADAIGDPSGMVTLLIEHDGGATSSVTLSGRAAVPQSVRVDLYGSQGGLSLDASDEPRSEAFATLRREFSVLARGSDPHVLDALHGLHLQEVVDNASRALRDYRSRRGPGDAAVSFPSDPETPSRPGQP